MFASLACGAKRTFNEQINDDVLAKMGHVPCDSVPLDATVSNVTVGEIVPIGDTGLIDVTIEFDYQVDNRKLHKKDALLYSKSGNTYTLEKIGGCEYSKP